VLFRLDLQEMAGTGFEQPQETSGKTTIVVEGGAESGALGAQSPVYPPDLQSVIEGWDFLPEPTKVGILAMVRSSFKGDHADRGIQESS
jgi:hypothetical protein